MCKKITYVPGTYVKTGQGVSGTYAYLKEAGRNVKIYTSMGKNIKCGGRNEKSKQKGA